ncbi:tripartite tricarboxylate transporter substrate-binding protein [Pelagibius sp. Alg239-R121]|uniref:tripartite tricarboxylate transporter substrate-binding protein n=1 Tax=Pelagibius sp. Alg239-R121 TaxID=2993448 RepID=UPI0024A6A9AF|nr:tripartite tricarboxylate transporter substrate-binding protein [Pelagibius sp. Alg239-R121]
MKSLIGTVLSGALLALSATFWAAQAEYPEKPVSFVVPFPPGDLEDVLTRLIAEDFQAETGVAAAVVNKPGGGGGPFPGAIEVANAPADGTMVGSFVIGVPVVGPTIGIDELKEDTFEPVGIFLTYPFVVVAKSDAPFGSMKELAAHAQDHEVALGHFGSFLIPTQISFAAAKTMGFEWGSEAAFDAVDCNTLASGDADVINTTLQLVLPCLKDVKVLAAITDERIPIVPDSPTMAEVAPSLNASLWNGLFVKKGTPQEVKDKIAAIAKKTVMGERAQKIAAETGAGIYWMDAATAAKRIENDRATVAKINEMIGE